MAAAVLSQVHYTRTMNTGDTPQDDMINALYWEQSSGTVTSTDLTNFNTDWSAFWTAWKIYASSHLTFKEIRHYVVPASPGPLGSPAAIYTPSSGNVGTGSGEQAPQVAASVTLRTGERRHWGRIYLPGLVGSTVNFWRISSSVVDLIGGAFHTFAQACVTHQGTGLVVWNRSSWSGLPVTEISMDDVWDVQRRRRLDQRSHLYDAAV